MLQLYDIRHNKIAALEKINYSAIEHILESGDSILTFSYARNNPFYNSIIEEGYIRTKNNEYVIKDRGTAEEWDTFKCSLNIEDLEGKPFGRFESVEKTITEALNLAIAGTGWTVIDNNLLKKRTVRETNSSAWKIIQSIKKRYRVDMKFDAINKKIYCYEKLGQDKGTYFIEELNLKALEVQTNTYDFYTRIIPLGKEGLTIESVNGGRNYVENHQYSNKIKTFYWTDDRYTVAQSLKEDAEAKLNELSKPRRSYSASIANLAKLNPVYKNILDYSLGDTITLISNTKKVKEKQRIVKIVEYPLDHSQDTIEITNTFLNFEDIQQEFEDTVETVNNITLDNGTIDGTKIDSISIKQIKEWNGEGGGGSGGGGSGGDVSFDYIKVKVADIALANIKVANIDETTIQIANIIKTKIGEAEITTAFIADLKCANAHFDNITANKISTPELEAILGKIQVLESNVANINHLFAGNITAEHIQAGTITAGSGIIADGAIGNAQISSLSANKITAGTIDTSLVTVSSRDGAVEISGYQVMVNDTTDPLNVKNRVILGKYRNGEVEKYGLLIRGSDGQTTMWDENGATNAGITNGAITDNKISDNADIQGYKLNINSVVRKLNENGTESIHGTKIQVGDRSLDVELSTQNNLITANKTELTTQKSQIQALDKAITLKVDTQTFNQTITNLDAETVKKINAAKTELKNEITDVNTSVGNLENTMNGAFKDSIISQAETIAIKENLTQIDKEHEDLMKQFQAIHDNATLPNSNKVELIKLKAGFQSKYDVLKNTIVIAIADKKITVEEQTDINNKLKAYSTALANLSTALQNCINVIAKIQTDKALETSKTYTDNAVTVVETELLKATSEIKVLQDKIKLTVSKTEVNTIKADLEGKIQVNATKISENKAEIIQTTDGIKQQVSNLNSSLTTVQNNLNNTISTINTVSNKVSTLETNVNGITGRVENVEITTEKLNNIQIGGSNLLSTDNIKALNCIIIETDKYKDIPTYNFTMRTPNTENNLGLAVHNLIPVQADSNTQMIISFYYYIKKYSHNQKLGGYIKIKYSDNSTQNFSFGHLMVDSLNSNNYNKWHKLEYSFVTDKKQMIGINNLYIYSSFVLEGDINITAPMIEFGNKATDWKYPSDEIKSDISKVSSQVSELKITTESITNRVSSVETTSNTLNNKVSTVTEQVAQLEIKSDRITSSVSSLQLSVDSMDAMNLVPNSSAIYGVNAWYYDKGNNLQSYSDRVINQQFKAGKCFAFSNNSNREQFARSYCFPIKAGTKYTISCKYIIGKNSTGIDLYVLGSREYRDNIINTQFDYIHACFESIYINKQQGIITKTFETYSDEKSAYIRVDNNGRKNQNDGSTIYFGEIMLAEGTTVKEWNSSPNDLKSSESKIEQLSDKITLTVKKGEIISAIEQSSEQIKISANKINLKGYVTFTNLETNGQTLINGGNIKADTIDATKIKADAITSHHIKAGTISSNLISANGISADKIKGGTIEGVVIKGVTINGSKFEGGNIKTQNLQAAGEVHFFQDANVSGDFTINKDNFGKKGGLIVSGAGQVNEGFTCKGILYAHEIQKSLNVPNLIINTNSAIKGNLIVNGTLSAYKSINITETLTVGKETNLGKLVARVPNASVQHEIYGNTSFSKDVNIHGNVSASNLKSIIKTKSNGTRELNVLETTQSYVEDFGRTRLANGECIIPIDIIFSETVSLERGYDVFITKYAKDDIWVEERNINFFKVKGDSDIEFSWRLVARKKGFENSRLKLINN